MVVGILFYHWKTILVVGSKYGRNLIIGSSHSRWGSILAVGSHPTSIWTIRCTWNWSLELGPNLDRQINAGKLGAVGSAVGARRQFFQKIKEKIAEINRNKRKFLWNFPTRGDFFKKPPIFLFLPKFLQFLVKFTDISFVDISPPSFVSLTLETRNFTEILAKKTEIFILVHNLISFCNYSHPCANGYS